MRRLIIAIHAAVIILAYSSPFWLDWRVVAIGVGLYWLQNLIFRGCVLSQAQFKDKRTTFHEWYLAKLGIRPNHRRLKIILDVWLPVIILALAFTLQSTILRPWLAI